MSSITGEFELQEKKTYQEKERPRYHGIMTTYTIKQAAERLNISKAAVRKRLERMNLMGQLTRESGPQGRLLIPEDVLLELDTRHQIPDTGKVSTQNGYFTEDKMEKLSDKQQYADTERCAESPDTDAAMLPALIQEVSALSASVSRLSGTVDRLTTLLEDKERENKVLAARIAQLEADKAPECQKEPPRAAGLNPEDYIVEPEKTQKGLLKRLRRAFRGH